MVSPIPKPRPAPAPAPKVARTPPAPPRPAPAPKPVPKPAPKPQVTTYKSFPSGQMPKASTGKLPPGAVFKKGGATKARGKK
jgi:hypothetical protein